MAALFCYISCIDPFLHYSLLMMIMTPAACTPNIASHSTHIDSCSSLFPVAQVNEAHDPVESAAQVFRFARDMLKCSRRVSEG